MGIKVEKLDTKKEERVLLSMVVSTEFLNRMLSHIDITLFSSRASKTIVKWCTSYFEKYEKAPGNDLNVIYENSELELNDTDRQYIAGLLGKIGELSKTVDSESFNIEYQVDQAYEYFRSRKLDKLVSKVQNDLMSGKVDSAEDQVVQYMAVEKETSTGIDLFRDLERLKVMGLDEGTILFQPPGAFGEMTGPVRREDFIMFLASAKAGKSTMVQQMGMWASVGAQLNVLHLSLEMPEEQVKDRYYSAFTGMPTSYFKGNKELMMPYFTEEGRIEYRTYNPNLLNPDDIVSKAKAMQAQSKGSRLIVEARPQNSFSVRDLKMMLDKYETIHGIVFDVLILDYADLMLSDNPRLEYRHRLDDVYKSLRGMAQERKIAIITVSQGNREGFKKGNSAVTVSEDIRKLATVTGAFAINFTDEEKRMKYWRMSPMVIRNQHFNEGDTVVCLNSLDISRMVLDSRWSTDAILQD